MSVVSWTDADEQELQRLEKVVAAMQMLRASARENRIDQIATMLGLDNYTAEIVYDQRGILIQKLSSWPVT